MGLDQMGLIDAIEIGADGDVDVRMRLTSPACLMVGIFKEEIQNAVGAVPGVRHVDVSFDQGLDWTPDLIRSPSHEHADARA
jgi:metal-sulfur cluster biosynthetic enzyme